MKLYFTPYTQINLKCIIYLNIKYDTYIWVAKKLVWVFHTRKSFLANSVLPILPARTSPHSPGPVLADGSLGQAQLCHLPQMLQFVLLTLMFRDRH